MTGVFLEKAEATLRKGIAQGNKVAYAESAMDCFVEILAVVEAAEKATWRWEEADHEMGQASADDALCRALDALEKKADAL